MAVSKPMNTDVPNQVPIEPQLPVWDAAIPIDVVYGTQYAHYENTEPMLNLYPETTIITETAPTSTGVVFDADISTEPVIDSFEDAYQSDMAIAEARANLDAVSEVPEETNVSNAVVSDTVLFTPELPETAPARAQEAQEPEMHTFVMTRRKQVMLAAVSGIAVLLGHAEHSDTSPKAETVVTSTAFAETATPAVTEQLVPAAEILRPQTEALAPTFEEAPAPQFSVESTGSIFDQNTLVTESMSFEALPSEPDEYAESSEMTQAASETEMTSVEYSQEDQTENLYDLVNYSDAELTDDEPSPVKREPTDLTFSPVDDREPTLADSVKTLGLLLFAAVPAWMFRRQGKRMHRQPVAVATGPVPITSFKTFVKTKVPVLPVSAPATHRKRSSSPARKVMPEIRYTDAKPSLLERLLPKRLNKAPQPVPLSPYSVDVLQPVSNGHAGSMQPGFGGTPGYFAGQGYSTNGDDDQAA